MTAAATSHSTTTTSNYHYPTSPLSSPFVSPSSRQHLLSPDRAARSALGEPVSYLAAHGIHTNGKSVTPNLVQRLSYEVEMLKEKLRLQEEENQAGLLKIQILEKTVENNTGNAIARAHDLARQVTTLRSDLAASRSETESWRIKAESAELRRVDLEEERSGLRRSFEGEVSAALKALGESQKREGEAKDRAGQLEAELERLTDLMKMDRAAIEALKRQLGPYSGVLSDTGVMEPGLVEVAERTAHLLQLQGNPEGEKYALQKVLATHSANLRAVFLHYVQLEGVGGGAMKRIWPPAMSYGQWMLFCKETQTADTRALALPSSKTSTTLSLVDCEAIFVRYSKSVNRSPAAALGGMTGGGTGGAGGGSSTLLISPTKKQQQQHSSQILSYELWLSSLVQCAFSLRPATKTFPFLSEAVREYLLKHIIMGVDAYLSSSSGGHQPLLPSSPHRTQRVVSARLLPSSPSALLRVGHGGSPAPARASSSAASAKNGSTASPRKKSGIKSRKPASAQLAWAEAPSLPGDGDGDEDEGIEESPATKEEVVRKLFQA